MIMSYRRRLVRHARTSLFVMTGLALAESAGPPASAQQPPPATELTPIDVIGNSPLLGSGVDRDKVPAASTSLGPRAIQGSGAADALGALERIVPGLVLDNAAGNPEQPNVSLHGFQVSPLQGTSQGLAVYVNGIRFNQAFGDTVNWDLLPDLAIDRLDVVGSNPAFGLNALGGAINVQLKNGFSYQGGEAILSGGSFGRVEGQLQYGVKSGDTAAYFAATGLHEDGWRDLQSSDLQNFFGDLGWRGDRAELHVSVTASNSALNGPGTSPVQFLDADPAAQFTAPNAIHDKFLQIALSGSYDVTDMTSVQTNAYYGYFQQRVVNGNVASLSPCDDGTGDLCEAPGVPATDRAGNAIPDFLSGGPYSQLDQQTTNTNGFGISAQVTNTEDVFGHKNEAIGGLSFDGARTLFDAVSQIGGFSALDGVFLGPGVTIDQADGSIAPVRVAVDNSYYGAFLTDTADLTPRVSLTLSGRFNAADITLSDQLGGSLSGQHSYNRFNPASGLAYRIAPWLTAYAGYAESNRAPTPAELSCASAAAPCSLANFFVGDPDLKQVVAHTVEAGFRGKVSPAEGATLRYDLGVFHTDLNDDIEFVNSPIAGRAFFQNVGNTRRQGIDAGVSYEQKSFRVFLNYSYTDATFQNGFIESSQYNPGADANGDITVKPGNHLPGVPAHVAKFGVEYRPDDQWTLGVTGLAESGATLFGDEANLTAKLPGFVRFDLTARYRVTANIEIFGVIQNVTNAKYYTYGTFSPTSAVAFVQAPNASNPRSYSPAAPIGGFAGTRVTF